MGMVGRISRGSLFAFRVVLVVFMWFGAVPVLTSWFWRLAFARSLQHAYEQVTARLHPALFLMDVVYGSFLSAAIVFVFLGINSLRGYIQQLRVGQDNDIGDAQLGEEEGAGAGLRAGVVAEAAVAEAAVAEVPPRDAIGARGDDTNGGAAEMEVIAHTAVVADAAGLPRSAVGGGGGGGPSEVDELEAADDGDHRFAEEVAAFDDLPMEELLGLRGPLVRLFEHAATLMTSNACFLVVAAFFPYNVGHLVLSAGRSPTNHATPPPPINPGAGGVIGAGMAAGAISCVASFLQLALNAARATGIIPAAPDFASVATTAAENKLQSELAGRKAVAELEAQLAPQPLGDLATLVLGYVVLAAVGTFWLITLSLIRMLRSNTRVGGSVRHILTGTLIRHVLQFLRHSLLILKVVLLLIIELGVFPTICGWWLDLNALIPLGSTLPLRISFHASSPVICTAVHWAAGLVYMLHVSVFIAMVGRCSLTR